MHVHRHTQHVWGAEWSAQTHTACAMHVHTHHVQCMCTDTPNMYEEQSGLHRAVCALTLILSCSVMLITVFISLTFILFIFKIYSLKVLQHCWETEWNSACNDMQVTEHSAGRNGRPGPRPEKVLNECQALLFWGITVFIQQIFAAFFQHQALFFKTWKHHCDTPDKKPLPLWTDVPVMATNSIRNAATTTKCS